MILVAPCSFELLRIVYHITDCVFTPSHSWSTSCPALIQYHGARRLVPRSSTMLGRGRSIGRPPAAPRLLGHSVDRLLFDPTSAYATLSSEDNSFTSSSRTKSCFIFDSCSDDLMTTGRISRRRRRALDINPRLDFRARQSPFLPTPPLCLCAGIRTRGNSETDCSAPYQE